MKAVLRQNFQLKAKLDDLQRYLERVQTFVKMQKELSEELLEVKR